MGKAKELLELAERVEALTGPDREVDARLSLAVNDWAARESALAPFYTRSVDTAALLMPQHTLWAVGRMEEGPFARLCIPQPDGGYGGGYIEVKANTVPLAICIAALRALAATEQ